MIFVQWIKCSASELRALPDDGVSHWWERIIKIIIMIVIITITIIRRK